MSAPEEKDTSQQDSAPEPPPAREWATTVEVKATQPAPGVRAEQSPEANE